MQVKRHFGSVGMSDMPVLCFHCRVKMAKNKQMMSVLTTWRGSKRSSRRSHSPRPRREVPTLPLAAEETHLVASPASSWVETTCFVFLFFHLNTFYFYFLKINTPYHSLPPHQPSPLLHLLHMHSCHHVHGPLRPLPPPSNLLF